MAFYGTLVNKSVDSLFEQYFEIDDSIEISAEEMQRLCKYEISDFEVLTESANPFQGLEKAFSKLGLSKALPKTKQAISSASKDIGNTIKKKGITKESRKSIMARINDCLDQISEALEEYMDDIDITFPEDTDPKHISNSIGLVLTALIVNSLGIAILQIVAALMAGPAGLEIGSKIGACIIAPIVEEFCKRTANKGGYLPTFLIVFNIAEASLYITSITATGVKITKAIIIRGIAIGLHISTSVVQWITSNEKFQKFIGLDKLKNPEDAKKSISAIGYIVGVLMHALYNFSGTFGKLAKWANAFAGLN
jgi:hypothetical protein